MKRMILFSTLFLSTTLASSQNYPIVKVSNFTDCNIQYCIEFAELAPPYNNCQDIVSDYFYINGVPNSPILLTRDDFNNTIGFLAPSMYGGLPGIVLSDIWVSRMKVALAPGQGCSANGADIGDCSVSSMPYSSTTDYVVGTCSCGTSQIKAKAYYDSNDGFYKLIVTY